MKKAIVIILFAIAMSVASYSQCPVIASLSGESNPCESVVENYQANVTYYAGTNWFWTVTGGSYTITSSDFNDADIRFNEGGTFVVRLLYQKSGCTEVWKTKTVTVKPIPDTPSKPIGPSVIEELYEYFDYYTPAVSGATSYWWTIYSSGGYFGRYPDSDHRELELLFTTWDKPYYLKVASENECGRSSDSSTKTVWTD